MRGFVTQEGDVPYKRGLTNHLEVHVRDEGQVEVGVVGDGVVAATEEAEEPLPLLEGVVVLPH